MISLFGRGLGRGGIVTLSDSTGRFVVPYLPAGSYTLRALGEGHEPVAAQKVTVLPNRDLVFTLSLKPLGQAATIAAAAMRSVSADPEAQRELTWLLRHKRRSVLEAEEPRAVGEGTRDEGPEAATGLSELQGLFDGTVEVVALPPGFDGERTPTSLGLVRLSGRLAEKGLWTVGGLLSESEERSWRTAGEFLFEPGGGHRLRAGLGYGSRLLRPRQAVDGPGGEGVGAVLLEDRWEMGRRWALTGGARLSYVGYLRDTNHFDPALSFEFAPSERRRLRGGVSARSLVPGGDLLTVSTLATAPAVAFALMGDDLRAERILRAELSLEQRLGSTSLRAHTFYEGVGDRLVNSFDETASLTSLRITNGGRMAARGLGLTIGRSFGDVVRGSVSYTYGRSWRPGEAPALGAVDVEGQYHDLATRFETAIEGTGTRVVAFYRLNVLEAREGRERPVAASRFDVQLSQQIPFLAPLTRADWEFLLAVRNVFYEAGEGAELDDVATQNPPKRVLGGLSVSF